MGNAPQTEFDARSVIDRLMNDAAGRRASDVHFEPTAHGYEARFRIDGLLQVAERFDAAMGKSLVNRLMAFFQGIAADKATTMGHIKREHLAQAEIALPPQAVLHEASRIIEPIYERVHRAERQCSTLSALRDALLPQLMSGELQLTKAKRAVLQAVGGSFK